MRLVDFYYIFEGRSWGGIEVPSHHTGGENRSDPSYMCGPSVLQEATKGVFFLLESGLKRIENSFLIFSVLEGAKCLSLFGVELAFIQQKKRENYAHDVCENPEICLVQKSANF